MTEALYLEDSYLKECEASVKSVNGKEVVLDRTIFYPRGGGQPCDNGRIDPKSNSQQSVCGSGFRVLNVVKKEGAIVHELDREPSSEAGNPKLETGSPVCCVIDWKRRYRLMRMHTAAHVLAAMMHKELGVLISGNQLEEDKTRFDFNMESFERNKFEDVVKKANEALASGAELHIFTLPREEAMKIPGIVKLAGALPPSITILRIVEIPGIDIQADGGTHVKNLKEVGRIEILKLENKGKDNRRIYFTLSE